MTRDFRGPVFQGGRFESHEEGLSVDALADVLLYQEIVLEVAKSIFKRQNPGRQRVPAGFEERLALRVTQVRPGSRVPVLERTSAPGQLPIPDEFDEAADVVARTIAAGRVGGEIPAGMPRTALTKFGRMGRKLRPGESIGFQLPDSALAIFDAEVRSKLLLAGGLPFPARETFIGYVTDLNSSTAQFEIRLATGRTVAGPYGEFWDEMHECHASPPENGFPVVIDADAEFEPDGTPRKLSRVHGVQPQADWQNAMVRIAEFRSLRDGWFDGAGETPSEDSMDVAEELVFRLGRDGVPSAATFPTPDGGALFQWRMDDRTISAEVLRDGHVETQLLVVSPSGEVADGGFRTFPPERLDEVSGQLAEWLDQ